MGWSQSFHNPVLADVMTFTSEGVPLVSLTFRDANRQECKIITPHIIAAIAAADAFNAEVSRSRAGQKPQSVLDWKPQPGGAIEAEGLAGHYGVWQFSPNVWRALLANDRMIEWAGQNYPTAEAAQAACEAHYRGENGPVTA
jgi:hypothetical protein